MPWGMLVTALHLTCLVGTLSNIRAPVLINWSLESRWTQFATMGSAPTPRLNHAMAADGTKLILFGGGRRTAHELDPVVHVLHSGA